MQLSDIFIYTLKELNGFDEEAVEKAIILAQNDIVESVEELVDFINFSIEEKKFPGITQPYDEKIIKKAVDIAKKKEGKIVHHILVAGSEYPQKLKQAHIGVLAPLAYKGNLINIERKTIMITGSDSVTNNAKLASKYFGKLFASKGYNIITSFSPGCEQCSILGCVEASGFSTFFLPHSIEHLTAKQKKVIQSELEAGRATVISVSDSPKATKETIDESYRYLSALADCLIIPQISINDSVMDLAQIYFDSNKPVFLIQYKTGSSIEYDCEYLFEVRGSKYLSSDTALKQVVDAIGTAHPDAD